MCVCVYILKKLYFDYLTFNVLRVFDTERIKLAMYRYVLHTKLLLFVGLV